MFVGLHYSDVVVLWIVVHVYGSKFWLLRGGLICVVLFVGGLWL